MNCMGVDSQTTNISWVLITDDGGAHPYRVEAKGRTAEDRFAPLIRCFRQEMESLLFPAASFPYVYLEKPVLTRNAKATIYQSMVVGAIRAYLMAWGIPHSLVDNTVWKKGLLGSGNASKEEIHAWVVAAGLLPEGLTQDEYDAACIAQYGRLAMSRLALI